MQCGWREEAVQCEWRERERESADNVGVGLPGARRREPTEPLQTLLLGKGLDARRFPGAAKFAPGINIKRIAALLFCVAARRRPAKDRGESQTQRESREVAQAEKRSTAGFMKRRK